MCTVNTMRIQTVNSQLEQIMQLCKMFQYVIALANKENTRDKCSNINRNEG